MTRHAKNATAASVYTYHERRKDASVSGYGTLHERLGKDSMKSFDCCSLSLQPCRFSLETGKIEFAGSCVRDYFPKTCGSNSCGINPHSRKILQPQKCGILGAGSSEILDLVPRQPLI